MSRHLLEFGKHIGGLNKENTGIRCCYVPERRRECRSRTWQGASSILSGEGRAAGPAASRERQQHAGGGRSILPAVLTSAGTFPRRDVTRSPSFSSLSHYINAAMFFFHESVQVFLKRLFHHAKKWWTHFLLMAFSEVQKHNFRFSSSLLCSTVMVQKQTSGSPFPKNPSSHVLCDTPSQGNKAWAQLWARPSLLTLTFIPIQSTLIYPYF